MITGVVSSMSNPNFRANGTKLKSLLQTIAAEKNIEIIKQGKVIQTEHVELIFQQPDECLIRVKDSKGDIERTEYSIGQETIVSGGRFRQKSQDEKPRAWDKVFEFLRPNMDLKRVVNYRFVLPGIGIPNCFERPFGPLIIRESLVSITVNADVSRQLLNRGI
jgi:hypothetical protein